MSVKVKHLTASNGTEVEVKAAEYANVAKTATTATSATSASQADSVPWTGVTDRPTKVSQFQNDSGFVTSSGTIANATKATNDSNGSKISDTYLKKSGGDMTGQLGVTSIKSKNTDDDYIHLVTGKSAHTLNITGNGSYDLEGFLPASKVGGTGILVSTLQLDTSTIPNQTIQDTYPARMDDVLKIGLSSGSSDYPSDTNIGKFLTKALGGATSSTNSSKTNADQLFRTSLPIYHTDGAGIYASITSDNINYIKSQIATNSVTLEKTTTGAQIAGSAGSTSSYLGTIYVNGSMFLVISGRENNGSNWGALFITTNSSTTKNTALGTESPEGYYASPNVLAQVTGDQAYHGVTTLTLTVPIFGGASNYYVWGRYIQNVRYDLYKIKAQ